MPTPIEYLKSKFPSKVFLTDAELENVYGKSDTWKYMTEGNENEVFDNQNGFVIKRALAPLSEDDYDGDDDEDPSDTESEQTRRMKRFKLELSIPTHACLTTTMFVSPTYSVEKKIDSDIVEYINNTEKPSLTDRLKFCLDIYTGIDYIHADGKAHLDLKPENIFIYHTKMSIGDFGFLRKCNKKTPTDLSKGHTPGWVPHETMSRKRCKEVDMYSAALICIGILSWESNIILLCREFVDSVNYLELSRDAEDKHSKFCKLLRGVFDDVCFFPKEEDVNVNFLSDLKDSILGKECDYINISASKVKKTIENTIRRIKLMFI